MTIAPRALGLVVALAALAAVAALSLAVGARTVPWETVVDALLDYDAAVPDQLAVHELRVPRTVLGLLVGAALGLAGALMQGIARNPLADPGILGINAGASLLVVLAIYLLGVSSLYGYIWFALVGALAAAVVVYGVGSLGRGGATPVKLCIAGAAVTALLASSTSAVLLLDQESFDQYRLWAVGSLVGREPEIAWQLAPFIGAGLLAALLAGPALNALALGDDVARSLGQRVRLARTLCVAVIVLLAGAATAAAGPIVFVGLVVPHVARLLVGPDYRWILPYSAVLAPILLLGSDVLGRLLARPSELQAGLLTALIGAPVFVWLVRRRDEVEL